MDDKEFDILLNFLKSGLSTRQLDRLLGINDKNGWISWRILKKYGIKKYDKSKLFFYSTRQSENIIRKLIKSHEKSSIDSLITKNPPANLEKYKNTFVIADSEKSFYKIMSGETRNIIKNFFNPKKKLIGKCQFINCKVNNSQIDTVHFLKDRPEIFIQSATKYKTKDRNNLYKFDVYKTMKCFLMGHSKPKSVCFLCKKHHEDFHRSEKEGRKKLAEFRRNILFL